MSGICVNKVLIDGGVTISLLSERMLIKVEKHFDDSIPTNISVTDYSGVSTPAKDLVTFQVQVGSSSRTTVFVVISSKASYNALLGRDWIYGVGAIPLTVHQSILLWTDEGKSEVIKADSSLNVEQMHVGVATGRVGTGFCSTRPPPALQKTRIKPAPPYPRVVKC
ncbi:hypothetical protein Ahy_B06g083749 [Arachis hypogaea]|uniref:Peptidase A2 domain-containing protein n=1 Tax=Arachis hypogaea TaxID=3818 RepID=A0A444YQC5_ARAHY|nr:hypothetical protein Ahy_B06g083749 [Arachis hypogaea]